MSELPPWAAIGIFLTVVTIFKVLEGIRPPRPKTLGIILLVLVGIGIAVAFYFWLGWEGRVYFWCFLGLCWLQWVIRDTVKDGVKAALKEFKGGI